MNKIVSMDEMVVIMKEQLERGGKVEFTPKGISMLPMLRHNQDVVMLEKQKGKLQKYDLPLYQRDNGKYVLHRVIKVCEDGSYVMCGDNQVTIETGIRDENIIGIVTEFVRKGKRYSCCGSGYKIYCRIWCSSLTLRKILLRIRGILGKIKRWLMRHKKVSYER